MPKGGGVSSLFAGALWIGAFDEGGTLRVAAQTYRQNGNDFFPGPLDASGSITQDLCNDFDRIWKVNRSTIDSFRWGLLPSTTPSIRYWPGRGNPYLPFLPDQDLAPFFDYNNDGNYDSSTGDYPSVQGDQALWYVFNDKGNDHSETGGEPMSLEIKATAYSYQSGCLDNTTFYQYRITNKGNNLTNTYIGLWADADLGYYTDDYIGCDTVRNMGIVYNGTADDGGLDCSLNYGTQAPYLGIRVIELLGVNPLPEKLMTNFMAFYNDFSSDGNPQNAEDYYGYLKSEWTDGTPLTYGGNGQGGVTPTNYIYPGDPSVGTEWSECSQNNPFSDKRFIISTGPFDLPAGSEIQITYAAIWVRPPIDTYPCPAFSMLQDTADCIAEAYGSFYPTGIPDPAGTFISVYPNPANDRIHLPDVNLNGASVSVLNVLGEVVLQHTKAVPGSYMDISQLTRGVYFLEIAATTEKFVGKFVKD